MAQVNIASDAAGNIIASGYEDQPVYNLGNMAFIIMSTALVWIMIPGVGFFYSGLLRRKNALSMIYLSMACLAVTSFQWFFWGYSLAFSDTATNGFIGNLKYFALRNVLDAPSIGGDAVPASLYMIFQCMFACITAALAVGGVAERSRLGPLLVFVFVFITIVYCPIACWTWNSNGWSFVMGGLDFAGGTPVHINSGTASLALAFYLGKRRGYGTERLAYKPHATTHVLLGTILLWFGWFGFNGGSALAANLRAVSACIVTNLAASVGGITWLCLDWRLERKWSAVGFCSGAICGLVAITPGSGYVGAPAAVLFGFVGAVVCNFATRIKFLLSIDEALDVFATHAVGGVVGNILTGLFAQGTVASLDGSEWAAYGWLDHHWVQLGYQIADSVAGMAYSFVMTTAICWAMHFIPGLRLRCSEEDEIVGIDDAEMGEFAFDYIGLDPEARMVHHEGHPTITASSSAETPRTVKPEDRSFEYDKEQGNEAAGGGRVDA